MMVEVIDGPKMVPIEDEVEERYPGVSALYVKLRAEPRKEYDLEAAISRVLEGLKFTAEELKDLPKVRAYRDFYWRMGIDPTKQRPASEALVRRLIKRRSIPKISYIVDAGNLASIETLIPIGIYDSRFVRGWLRLRLAKDGERFIDIVGNERHLKPHEIVLADEEGPLHIFPYRDSYRTRVREDTEEIFVVACGVHGIEVEDLREALDRVAYWLSEL